MSAPAASRYSTASSRSTGPHSTPRRSARRLRAASRSGTTIPTWYGAGSTVISDGEVPAVDHDGRAGDEAGVGAGQEGDDTGDLVRGAEAGHRGVGDLGVVQRRDLFERGGHAGADDAGRHR